MLFHKSLKKRSKFGLPFNVNERNIRIIFELKDGMQKIQQFYKPSTTKYRFSPLLEIVDPTEKG